MNQNISDSNWSFKDYRHRWEMPMIWLSILITIAFLLLSGAIFIADSQGKLQWAGEQVEDLRTLSSYAYIIIAAPLFLYLYRFYMAAKDRANSIRVGPNQFPKLFRMYEDLGRQLGVNPLPRLYVKNGNGVVNAYALECNRRWRYVVLNSEVAMMIDKAPDTVRFVLAHELSHHKLGHVKLWRTVVGIVPQFMVLPGQAATRAQEYSADRLACAVCPDHARAVRLLAVGPWVENDVDPDAWLKQCEEERSEFFVRVSNSLSSHAVLVKRYKALCDIDAEGFKRHGDMF